MKYRLFIRWTVALVFVMLSLSCKEGPTDPELSASISISPRVGQAFVGQHVIFSYDLVVAGTTSELLIQWEVDNDDIASIEQNGVCTVKAAGIALVIVTVTGADGVPLDRDTATIFSGQYDISLSPKQVRLSSGQNYQLYAATTVFPVRWTSTDESVASVTQGGFIEVKGMGKTIVIAEARDSSDIVIDRDSCTVSVEWWRLLSAPAALSAFSASPDISSLLVGMTSGAGIMASSDGGTTWAQTNSGMTVLPSTIVREFARFRPSPSIVMTAANGVYISTDGGFSWNTTAITGDSIVSLVMHPTDNTRAYVTKEFNTLYLTTDGGSSWNSLPSPPAIVGLTPRLFADPTLPSVLYIGAHGSYVSTNSGTNWNAVSWSGQGRENAIMHVDNAGAVYLQDYNWDGTLRLRMMRSLNHGQTWTQVRMYAIDGYPFVYSSHPQQTSTLCVGSGSALSISTNGGQTWVDESTQPFASGSNVGVQIVATAPLEILCAIGNDVWRYRRAP